MEFRKMTKVGQSNGGRVMCGVKNYHSSELTQDPHLPPRPPPFFSHTPSMTTTYDDMLRFLPEYDTLLCMLCMKTHCIPLHGITEHLREFHADSLSKKQRGELVKYANSLKGRLMNPKDIRTPAREGGPVDGLYKIKGWECLECDKLLGTEDSMKKHCRGHGWELNKADMWKRTYIQVSNPINAVFSWS
jgi:Orsellinic acid/F9775 biosynthesis cluster protein D